VLLELVEREARSGTRLDAHRARAAIRRNAPLDAALPAQLRFAPAAFELEAVNFSVQVRDRERTVLERADERRVPDLDVHDARGVVGQRPVRGRPFAPGGAKQRSVDRVFPLQRSLEVDETLERSP